MKYALVLLLVLISHTLMAQDKKIANFGSPNEVAYSCTGNTCKVCISGYAYPNSASTGRSPKETVERVNRVCSQPFADGPTMKKAASFMHSVVEIMVKSGIQIPEDGFNFAKFVTAEKSKLCGSARTRISNLEAQLRSYREATELGECPSERPGVVTSNPRSADTAP